MTFIRHNPVASNEPQTLSTSSCLLIVTMFRSNARFLFALVVCLLLRLPSLCSYNFCPSCGFKVSGAKFCSDCGAGPFVNEAQSDAASAKSGDEERFVLKSFGEGEETIESFLPQFLEVRGEGSTWST